MIELVKKNKISINLIFATILYILYLAILPGMEGIVFRKDSDNKTFFSYTSVIDMCIQPFKNKDFWRIDMLDINYVVFLLIYFLIYYIITF